MGGWRAVGFLLLLCPIVCMTRTVFVSPEPKSSRPDTFSDLSSALANITNTPHPDASETIVFLEGIHKGDGNCGTYLNVPSLGLAGALTIAGSGNARLLCPEFLTVVNPDAPHNFTLTIKSLILEGSGKRLPHGAIRARGVVLTIERVTIKDFHSESDGGAISVDGCETSLTDVTVQSCQSDGRGGGLATTNGQTKVRSSSFDYNDALMGGAISGIAEPEYSNLDMEHVNFTRNSASRRGGAVMCESCSLQATSCRFEQNRCTLRGGGVSVFQPVKVFIGRTDFISNGASVGGGLEVEHTISDSGKTTPTPDIIISHCMFHNNGAFTRSASMVATGVKVLAVKMTVSGLPELNAVSVFDSTFECKSCVFTRNGRGGGWERPVFSPVLPTAINPDHDDPFIVALDEDPFEIHPRQRFRTVSLIECENSVCKLSKTEISHNCFLQEEEEFSLIYAANVLTLDDCRFYNNSVSGGAAVYIQNGEFRSNSTTFDKNLLYQGSSVVRCLGSDMILTNTTYIGNNGYNSSSAGVLALNCDVKCENCSFISNRGEFGGALALRAGSLTVHGEFSASQNRGKTGGAIHLDGATMRLYEANVTLNDNEATVSGGAIFATREPSCFLDVRKQSSNVVTLRGNKALGGSGGGISFDRFCDLKVEDARRTKLIMVKNMAATYGDDFASDPVRITFLETPKVNPNNFVTFKARVLDLADSIVTTINQFDASEISLFAVTDPFAIAVPLAPQVTGQSDGTIVGSLQMAAIPPDLPIGEDWKPFYFWLEHRVDRRVVRSEKTKLIMDYCSKGFQPRGAVKMTCQQCKATEYSTGFHSCRSCDLGFQLPVTDAEIEEGCQACPPNKIGNGVKCDDCPHPLVPNNNQTTCDCPPNTFGPNCNECPQCGNNGMCEGGLMGSGKCVCSGNAAGSFCEACREGYAGWDCSSVCPGGYENPCSGHGECVTGQSGGAECQCRTFAGEACDFPWLYTLLGCLGAIVVILSYIGVQKIRTQRGEIEYRKMADEQRIASVIQRWQINESDVTSFECVGSGASARVYRAEWQGVDVAKKVFFNPNEIGQEFDLLKDLTHPSIVRFYGACWSCSSPFILTEFMPSGTLSDFLIKGGACLSWKTRISLAFDIARGMHYLHHLCPQHPVLHRDLKIDNIFVTADGRARVGDFGLSQPIQNNAARAYIAGNICWAAPEIVYSLQQMKVNAQVKFAYSEKCDVYSYGMVLYSIVCSGLQPWNGYSLQEVEQVVVQGKTPPIPQGDREAIPPLVFMLMSQCWQLNPENRPSFADIVTILDSA